MKRYNNISYSFKQAKNMLRTHKGCLQMALPEWDERDSVRLYIKPRVESALYKANRDINPNLPEDVYRLPEDTFNTLRLLSKKTKEYLGDIITEEFLYKHSVRQNAYLDHVENTIYIPTSSEISRKDWILYKL